MLNVDEELQDRVQSISERLGVLEEAIIALPERRNKKITEDLNILEGQVCWQLHLFQLFVDLGS